MNKTHQITIGSITRELPIREVAPGVSVALFNPLGDWQLTEAAGQELAKLIPAGTEALVMPDGKAQALLHVLGRVSGLPTYVARKEFKPYMSQPVASVAVKSITTQKMQELYLGNEDAEQLRGKVIAIVDDVVSSGGTLKAMQQLLEQIGAKQTAIMAVFTEGSARPEVIALGHLPLYLT